MRVLALVFTILTLVLAGCGPASFQPSPDGDSPMAGTTGQLDENGVPYITNGNPRMEAALQQQDEDIDPPAPPAFPVPGSQPKKPAPPAAARSGAPAPAPLQKPAPFPQQNATKPVPLPLRLRMKEFEISRFNKDEKTPSRFGDDSYRIRIFFTDETDPAEFTGHFTANKTHFQFSASTDRYSLSGTLDDSSDLKTEGEMKVTDKKTGQSSQILYEAYKARLTVHQDLGKTPVPGSNIDQQLKNLSDNTYGWVHNWMVVRGRSFYLVDIVKEVTGNGAKSAYIPPFFAFKGESKRTGDQDHPAVSLNPDVSNEVVLVGNSETENRRWYQTKIEDPATKDQEVVILDVFDESQLKKDQENQGQEVQIQPEEPVQPEEPSPAPPNNNNNGPEVPMTPAPAPQRPNRPAPLKVEPVITGSSYLKIDNSLPRTARMSEDFARNRNLPGVQRWIHRYTSPSDGHFTDLTKFYFYGNPFRPMLEAIARAFDVSASFAYLTVIESRYLKSGNYTVEPINSAGAFGAFQFKAPTAREQHMEVDGHVDERAYFAPSACGAASYVRTLVNTFQSSDTTLAILGYNQGNGGAAKAIVCTYQGKGNCQGESYSRYLKLAKNYNFKFADIESVAAIPHDQIDYVDMKLAIYFVSSNMDKYHLRVDTYGARVRRDVPETYPKNGSVFPPAGPGSIHDPACRQAIQGLTGT